VSYVMAVQRSDTFTMPAGGQRPDALIAAVPARAWRKISAGAGAVKGEPGPATRA
jgi:hypothetical protein